MNFESLFQQVCVLICSIENSRSHLMQMFNAIWSLILKRRAYQHVFVCMQALCCPSSFLFRWSHPEDGWKRSKRKKNELICLPDVTQLYDRRKQRNIWHVFSSPPVLMNFHSSLSLYWKSNLLLCPTLTLLGWIWKDMRHFLPHPFWDHLTQPKQALSCSRKKRLVIQDCMHMKLVRRETHNYPRWCVY